MMYLDKRSKAILSELIWRDSSITVEEITKKFRISRRTVYYDLDKINDWLKSNGLEIVQYFRGKGYYIPEGEREKIAKKLEVADKWEYEYSADERLAWLAIYLLTRDRPLFLEDLSELIRVSRNTTIDDLKKLKKELELYSLQLLSKRGEGYIVQGSEGDKRKAIVYYLSKLIPEPLDWHTFLSNTRALFSEERQKQTILSQELIQIQTILNECEQELNIQFADDTLNSLVLRFWLFGKRIVQGKEISMDPIEKEIINQTKEFQAAKIASKKLEQIYHVLLPEDEVYYLATHLLSAKVQYSAQANEDDETRTLKLVAEKMVTDFQAFACVSFSNKKEVEANLVLHLKPAFYRIKYGLKAENPLADQIKRKYKDVYLITKKVIHHFETLVGESIHDDEIALIAVHFGGWLKKEGLQPEKRKKAIIVCPSGIGTSTILKHQLDGLFSTVDFIDIISAREYENRSYSNVDFIVSTVPIKEAKHPTFIVNPILNDKDKERLIKKVHALTGTEQSAFRVSVDSIMGIIKQYSSIQDEKSLKLALKEYLHQPIMTKEKGEGPNLLDILKGQYVTFLNEVNDWEDAIRKAAHPLLQDKVIQPSYVHAMIQYVKKLGPYNVVVPNVALPHGKPEDGALKLGMSLLILQKPVSFSSKENHQVRLLFVLSSIDNQLHLRALSQLSELLSSRKTVVELMECKTKESVLQILSTS